MREGARFIGEAEVHELGSVLWCLQGGVSLLRATAIKALIKPVPRGAVTASLLLIHLHLVHQKTDL